jgi:hypothetical protein
MLLSDGRMNEMNRLLLWAFLALPLAGCQPDADGGRPANGSNLLADPEFAVDKTGPDAVWRLSQHAGPRSYEWAVDEGVLSVTRIGPEPWGQATQSIPAADLVGRTLVFSAELSGNLAADSAETVERTGIGVRVRGTSPDVPAMLGPSAIQLSATGAPALPPGKLDWSEQRVEFRVPEGAEEVEVAIRLGTGGTLRARNPRLLLQDG